MPKTQWKILSRMIPWPLAFVGSCLGVSNRVVYVQDGQPVRLAEPVQAKVWVKDKDGKDIKSDNRVPIQEGWYALPDPGAKKTP